MRISSRIDYALSCILRIADKYAECVPVTINEISRRENLEPDYVEQLCVAMKKSGILKSVRGKNGGYVLATSPGKISAKEVMIAIDKNILEPVCYRKKGRRKKCIHFDDCEIRFLWKGLEKNMTSFLKGYSLEKLVRVRKKEKNW